jgi:tetratricopeptide (TPR) repeat protein
LIKQTIDSDVGSMVKVALAKPVRVSKARGDKIVEGKFGFPRVLLIIAVLLCGVMAQAQDVTGPRATQAEAANRLFEARDWTNAAKMYEAITRKEPANAIAWNRLGISLQMMSKYDQAIEAYHHAVESKPSTPVALSATYRLARVYSLQKNIEKGFEWLGKTIDAGFNHVETLKTEPDLENLRADARFRDFVAKADAKTRPCSVMVEARKFDFWIGEWSVQNQQGEPVGTSSVQLILGECVLFENWTGNFGDQGKSFNYYNAGSKEWKQLWVDNQGTSTEFVHGEYKDGAMRFQSERLEADGRKVLGRLTFFNIARNRIRQLAEESTDGGKTWTVRYDFLYRRKQS